MDCKQIEFYEKLKQEHSLLTPFLTLAELGMIYPEFNTLKNITDIVYNGPIQGKGPFNKKIKKYLAIEANLIAENKISSLPAYLLYLYYEKNYPYQQIAREALQLRDGFSAKEFMLELGIPLLTEKDSINRPQLLKARLENTIQLPEIRAKSLTAKKTEAYSEKMSKISTTLWRDNPEYQKNQAAAHSNLDFRKKLSEAQQKRVSEMSAQQIVKLFNGNSIAGSRKDIPLEVQLRSTWEANLARIFIFLEMDWHYAPTKYELLVTPEYSELFKTKNTYYFPDFKADGVYYEFFEIGNSNFSKRKLAKIELFKQQYPAMQLVVIDKKIYRELEKDYRLLIEQDERFQGWEYTKRGRNNKGFNLSSHPYIFRQ